MRLGQLARQLQVTPKEILSHIEKNYEVEIKTHPNSKIPDELVDPIIEALGTPVQEEVDTPETVAVEPVQEVISTEVETVETAEEEPEGPPEKVEAEIPVITGPKVVGKITLSEQDLNRTKPEKREKKERVKRVRERPAKNQRSKSERKILSDAEKRRMELEKLEASRKASAESLKELNRQRYAERNKEVEASAKSKKKKRKKAKLEQEVHSPVIEKAKPKSLFGKIWHWLNDSA